jgi:hypothetical protein
MKYLVFFLLLISFSDISAQEAVLKTIHTDNEFIISTVEDDNVCIDTTTIIVFTKKKASFYLDNFDFEKISKSKHVEFFNKKVINKRC